MTPKRHLSQRCGVGLSGVLLQSQQPKYGKHAQLNDLSAPEARCARLTKVCMSGSVPNDWW